ncbi:unnamed protein product [Rotaria sp. Silwood2]|nr:unnamed protein product [Rotaria sp. Silwood2]CAF4198637.1 unnamed protein product [Rotaria sp. Silwood2]
MIHQLSDENERLQKQVIALRTSPAEQVQMALRRGVEHLSSSFSKAQSTYATWIRSRAQHRKQARMNRAGQERE